MPKTVGAVNLHEGPEIKKQKIVKTHPVNLSSLRKF